MDDVAAIEVSPVSGGGWDVFMRAGHRRFADRAETIEEVRAILANLFVSWSERIAPYTASAARLWTADHLVHAVKGHETDLLIAISVERPDMIDKVENWEQLVRSGSLLDVVKTMAVPEPPPYHALEMRDYVYWLDLAARRLRGLTEPNLIPDA
jgi:hypothetical protein